MLCLAEEMVDEIDKVPALMNPFGLMPYLLNCYYMPGIVLPPSHVLILNLSITIMRHEIHLQLISAGTKI